MGERHWPAIAGRYSPGMASAAAIAIALTLGGAAIPARAAGQTAITASYAEAPGEPPTYIFPMNPPEFFTFANDQQFGYLVYRPLYWIGLKGQPLVNAGLSLAELPRFSVNAEHESVATITLKPYRWSDGTPITARDVAFWMNLLVANKVNWGDYVPGQFPDNVKAIAYPSPDTIRITFDKTYNEHWLLYNELVQITPIPQHAWDRTSARGAIGDYDETKKGAVAVWKFLNAQSRDGATYATNPLWKVVDGPWEISEYNPATGYVVMTPNQRYSGKVSGNIEKFVELPFTSSAAEFNALRSGAVDYGYIPLADALPGQVHRLASMGYQVVPWNTWEWNYWAPNFANPKVGIVFKQLYVRQALEHLVDQKAWIKFILHGYGTPEYSDIPLQIKNPFGDKYITKNHYPFSVKTAAHVLTDHGWKVVPGGTTTCVRPGTDAGQCGAGIKAGTPMDFTLEFSSGVPALKEEVVEFQTEAAKIGVHLSLVARPYNKVFADYFSCVGAPASECHWQIIAFRASTQYGWYPDYYPVGAANYNTGAVFNGQQYSDPEMDKLTARAHEEAGFGALHEVEDFTAFQLPEFWVPISPVQISAIKKGLDVPMPQGLEGNIYPETWTRK